MQAIQSDDSLINWAIAGASAGGVFRGYAGDASDQLLELVDRYYIFYSDAASNWYRLESQQAWLGQTVNLCGSHAVEWPDSSRHSGCVSLTRLLQAIAASMMPSEESECRHEMGDCVTRRVQVSTGIVCRHSLSVEISHPFSAISSRRHQHECLEQLECRLVISGIPPIIREREAPL